MEQTERATKRIHLMDELRGFAVFCMVFYHAFYTLAYLFNLEFGAGETIGWLFGHRNPHHRIGNFCAGFASGDHL